MRKEYWLLAYSILCWGTLPAVTKLTLTSIPNLQVVFITALIASICLFSFLLLSGRIKKAYSLTCKDYVHLVLLGFLGNFLYSILYYESLRTLPSADACIINYLWPIIATLCACALLQEKVKTKEWLATILSFIGVAIISTKGNGLALADTRGVLLCIAGSACYGVYNVLNKKKGLDQLLCTAIYFTVTAVCSLPLMLLAGEFAPISGTTWFGIIWLGVFIDAFSIFAWGTALQLAEVSILSNLAYLTPVVAMIISFLTLGEPIEAYAVMGMLFVLGGCLIQVISRKENNKATIAKV